MKDNALDTVLIRLMLSCHIPNVALNAHSIRFKGLYSYIHYVWLRIVDKSA